MGFISIKKKTRGLRSKVKRIDHWKEQSKELDLESIKKYGRDYVKIWIPPFYNLYKINKYEVGHKNPPNWFNKLILEAMLEVYDSWDKKLRGLNEPYYLKLWLYEPNFINSQIVAAIGDYIDYYEDVFEPDENKKALPIEKFNIKNDGICRFDWGQYKDQAIIYGSDFTDDLESLNYWKEKSYKIKKKIINDDVDVEYYITKGTIWVGEKRN
ncbi:hypothetical protein [Vallitalea okinawensis]|uniref:hypothetical protein n=1 Tax=Vallitalea okinawensis TaxID=2078660 RepID=UPI000CFBB13B|nr:hypothetical protein [Vallitalea okinawensis]